MLTVVTFRWKPPLAYRYSFPVEAVNILQRMVARCYHGPHEFVCVTDDPRHLHRSMRVVPLWADHATVPAPVGSLKHPSCYRRLKVFSKDIATVLGTRIVMLDLDTVLTGDVTPLWDRPEPIVLWGGTHKTTPYNGSMALLTAGARPQVWETFDPQRSPALVKDAGYTGSDQGWISYCLGPGEAMWSTEDGVYSYRNHLSSHGHTLPTNARIVHFHGRRSPWDPELRDVAWIRQHWRA